MTGQPPIRVLVADDHPVVLEGLCAIVDYQADMTVVARATDGEQACLLFEEHRPDVALIDLRMPRRDGVEVIAALRKFDPGARVVVLTTFDGDEDVYNAIRAGAAGYLLKDAPTSELLAAVRTAAAGGSHIPAEIARRLVEHARSGPSLSAREVEVLTLVAEGRSNREIAAVLEVGEATVKTHLGHVLEKLGAADRTEAVTVALRRGILRL